MADVVVRTPGLDYILGKTVGETNGVFIDSAGRQVGSIDISVTVDVDANRDHVRGKNHIDGSFVG